MDGQLQLNGKVLTMDQTLEEQGVKELVGRKKNGCKGMDSNGGRFMHVFLLLRKWVNGNIISPGPYARPEP